MGSSAARRPRGRVDLRRRPRVDVGSLCRLADAKTKAEGRGVRLVAPLGLFFLPAFLALGIGPLLAYLMAGIDM